MKDAGRTEGKKIERERERERQRERERESERDRERERERQVRWNEIRKDKGGILSLLQTQLQPSQPPPVAPPSIWPAQQDSPQLCVLGSGHHLASATPSFVCFPKDSP